MVRETYRKIIDLVLDAAKLARSVGIPNLLQPGLVKEMIIAEHLGHVLIKTKRDADAHAPGNPDEKYEYLSCKEGGSGQFDRMFKEPVVDREKSLQRIRRNSKIFFAVFYGNDQTRCKVIYEIPVATILEEAERQLDGSRNKISHVSFSENWAKEYGTIVYRDK